MRRRRYVTLFTFLLFLVLVAEDQPGKTRADRKGGKKRVSVKVAKASDDDGEDTPPGSKVSQEKNTTVRSPSIFGRNEATPGLGRDDGIVINSIGDNGALQYLRMAHREMEGESMFPKNLTAQFFGAWKRTERSAKGAGDDNITVFTQLREHSVVKNSKLKLTKTFGNFSLYLKASPSPSPFLSKLEGSIRIFNGESRTENDIRSSVNGLYLRKSGRVTIFANAIKPKIGVHMGTKYRFKNYKNKTNHTREKGVDEQDRKRPYPRVPTGDNKCFMRFDFDLKKSGDPSLKFVKRYGGSNAVEPVRIDGFARAPFNCHHLRLELSATAMTIDFEKVYSAGTAYGMFVCALVIWQFAALIKQVQFISTQAAAGRFSMLTVAMQGILDAVLCLGHFSVGFSAEPLFNTFGTIGFLKLISFSIFELRIVLMIWKSRRPDLFSQGWVIVRQEVSKVYSHFYCTLLIGLTLLYHLWDSIAVLVFLAYSFWVPQIVENAYFDVKKAMCVEYFRCMTYSRLFIPCYFWFYENNIAGVFFRTSARPILGTCLVLWVLLQAALLRAQERFGPRCFVPKRFLPEKYDYRRKVVCKQSLADAENGESEEINCSICLNPVEAGSNEYMVTPCDHFFHDSCLERWMDVKQECPVCRTVLPTI